MNNLKANLPNLTKKSEKLSLEEFLSRIDNIISNSSYNLKSWQKVTNEMALLEFDWIWKDVIPEIAFRAMLILWKEWYKLSIWNKEIVDYNKKSFLWKYFNNKRFRKIVVIQENRT